eukprot:TRINITY_DN16329_c0_g1_i1.p1 TRINITY_DN16329_c0_g1~~TRINITY_DN16329_c0_g1_i1.p1  ORF type:complete len:705 (+),score=87.54 TRINITY_DN16329_c0_g1_i1:98-2212(+)
MGCAATSASRRRRDYEQAFGARDDADAPRTPPGCQYDTDAFGDDRAPAALSAVGRVDLSPSCCVAGAAELGGPPVGGIDAFVWANGHQPEMLPPPTHPASGRLGAGSSPPTSCPSSGSLSSGISHFGRGSVVHAGAVDPEPGDARAADAVARKGCMRGSQASSGTAAPGSPECGSMDPDYRAPKRLRRGAPRSSPKRSRRARARPQGSQGDVQFDQLWELAEKDAPELAERVAANAPAPTRAAAVPPLPQLSTSGSRQTPRATGAWGEQSWQSPRVRSARSTLAASSPRTPPLRPVSSPRTPPLRPVVLHPGPRTQLPLGSTTASGILDPDASSGCASSRGTTPAGSAAASQPASAREAPFASLDHGCPSPVHVGAARRRFELSPSALWTQQSTARGSKFSSSKNSHWSQGLAALFDAATQWSGALRPSLSTDPASPRPGLPLAASQGTFGQVQRYGSKASSALGVHARLFRRVTGMTTASYCTAPPPRRSTESRHALYALGGTGSTLRRLPSDCRSVVYAYLPPWFLSGLGQVLLISDDGRTAVVHQWAAESPGDAEWEDAVCRVDPGIRPGRSGEVALRMLHAPRSYNSVGAAPENLLGIMGSNELSRAAVYAEVSDSGQLCWWSEGRKQPQSKSTVGYGAVFRVRVDYCSEKAPRVTIRVETAAGRQLGQHSAVLDAPEGAAVHVGAYMFLPTESYELLTS